MSKVQSHPDFWTFTRTSARDAVCLYFEPIRVFASWVSNHVELWDSKRQDVRARKRGVAAADAAWGPVLLERLEALNEEPAWASALKKGLLEQGRQLRELTEKVGQIFEAARDARHEGRQLDLLKGLKSKMEGMEAQIEVAQRELEAQLEGTRKELMSPRPRARESGLRKLSLADELRAIRGVGVHVEAPSKAPNPPAENERPWKSDLDRMEHTIQEALLVISELSGVQLPEGVAKPEGGGGSISRVDVPTPKGPGVPEDVRRASETRLTGARGSPGPRLSEHVPYGGKTHKPLALLQQLRGVRGGQKHSQADLEGLLSEIRDDRREWQEHVNQTQNLLHGLLASIAELAGVELHGMGPGDVKRGEASLRLDSKTLKDRIRIDLENFASAAAREAAKKAQSQGDLALESVEKEVNARLDNLADELRGELRSRLDMEQEELASHARARAEEVLQGMMDDPAEGAERRGEPGEAADRLKELFRQLAERPRKGAEK